MIDVLICHNNGNIFFIYVLFHDLPRQHMPLQHMSRQQMPHQHPPVGVFEGVVHPGLGHRFQAVNERLRLLHLGAGDLDEGLAIERVRDGEAVLGLPPLAPHCAGQEAGEAAWQPHTTTKISRCSKATCEWCCGAGNTRWSELLQPVKYTLNVQGLQGRRGGSWWMPGCLRADCASCEHHEIARL